MATPILLQKAVFEIFRTDPETEGPDRFDKFEIEYGERTTVLDVLRDIRNNNDGSLAFRASCRSAICGSCGMRINGYAKLACQTRVADAVATGTVTIEPLGNFPAIRDLIVDFDPFWHLNEGVRPYLEPKKDYDANAEVRMSRATVEKINRLADCILCACCTSSCNSYEVEPKFQGPAALAKSCRFALDPRDEEGADRAIRETKPRLAYSCCYCNFCTEVCPKDVRPAEAITILKAEGFTKGAMNHDTGARRSLTFYDTVRTAGIINEGTLPLRTKRLRVFGYIPLSFKLLARGKLPNFFPGPIDRISEVRTIYRNREHWAYLAPEVEETGAND